MGLTDESLMDAETVWPPFSDIALSLVMFLTFALIAQFLELSQVFKEMKIKREQDALWASLRDDPYFGLLAREGVLAQETMGNLQRLRFSGDVVFDTGSAALRPRGQEIMEKLALFLSENLTPEVMLEIEGHTDRQVVRGGRYADNWELSAGRALSVVRLVAALHASQPHRVRFEPEAVSAIGYGEHRPLEDAEESEINRRVEVRLDYSQVD